MGFQANGDDVVISCHGAVIAWLPNFPRLKVPPFVQVWVLAPPGAIVDVETVKMLERGEFVEALEIIPSIDECAGSLPLQAVLHEPTIYNADQILPPVLVTCQDRHVQGVLGGPNIVLPFNDDNLVNIWKIMVNPFCKQAQQRQKTLRVFLTACMGYEDSLGGGLNTSKRVQATNQPSRVKVERKK